MSGCVLPHCWYMEGSLGSTLKSPPGNIRVPRSKYRLKKREMIFDMDMRRKDVDITGLGSELLLATLQILHFRETDIYIT